MPVAIRQMTRCALLALLGAELGLSSVHAVPDQLPTSPLQNYYLEQRQIGAQSSEALSDAILYTAQRTPADGRVSMAEQAASMAPHRAEPHLSRARWSLLSFDLPGAMLALRDAWTAISADALQTARWGLWAQGIWHRSLLAALVAMAILLLARALPFLEHLLGSRMQAPRAVLFVLCSLVALALVSFPLLGSLVTLAVVAPFLTRPERAALGLLSVMLAGASLLLLWQQPQTLLADPSHHLHVLGRGNLETLSTSEVRRLENELAPSRERDVMLGLQAARRQQWHEAHRRYVEAMAQDSTWATTYVNLANLFFALSDFERAATGYRTAQSLDPGSPIPHANLAQAYIQMLRYEESDHELRMASSMGFDPATPLRPAWEHESRPVLDALLSGDELRLMARNEAAAHPEVAQALLAAWRGPGWHGVPITWLPWVGFVLAVWFLMRVRWSALAFECIECQRVTCRHCVPVTDESGDHCPRCEMIASRRAGNTLGDGTPGSRRPQRAHMADTGPDGIAVLFPGAAFLLLRAPALAVFTVLIGCTALVLVPNGWWAGAVFLGLYLPGLLSLRHRPRTVVS